MTRIQFNPEGFNQIRRDPVLINLVDDLADEVAARAGRGVDWKSRTDVDRHRAIVFTETARAMRVNAKHNTLLKALRGG